MDKKANTKYKINDLLENRWSPRAFSEKEIETEKLQRIFEAARWSPSSANSQPWRFIIGIKGRGDSYNKILTCLNESNQAWAKFAPVLVVNCGEKMFRDMEMGTFKYDVGQSVAYMTIQATSKGLFLHQMAGFSHSKIRETFGLSRNVEPIAVMTLGYLGKPDMLPEFQKERELAKRDRKGFDEIVFVETFGNPTDMFNK